MLTYAGRQLPCVSAAADAGHHAATPTKINRNVCTLSVDDKERWNRRYAQGAYGGREHPCVLLDRLVAQWSPVAPGSRALDLACGAGRNAIYLARCGYRVDALDISDEALTVAAQRADAAGVSVNFEQCDLDEDVTFEGYDLIVVVRYADLDLVRRLVHALRPGGRLLVEAHVAGPLFSRAPDAQGQPLIGGPSSERFRLPPGSLAKACAGLSVLHSAEAQIADPDGRLMALAQFVGQRDG